MKVAITGKGGVGKTTFAACLARLYADEGRKVLCADVDPDANLGLALGFSEEDLAKITPITEMKALIQERTEADQFEIMDMEAGLEHLSRGTTDMVDRFIVVVEPGARSIQTYHSVQRLAADLGVSKVSVVANKIRDEYDEAFIREQVPEEDLLGIIHYSGAVSDADRRCASPYDIATDTVEEIRAIKNKIDTDNRRS